LQQCRRSTTVPMKSTLSLLLRRASWNQTCHVTHHASTRHSTRVYLVDALRAGESVSDRTKQVSDRLLDRARS
jgi:hypothetical protein